MMMSDKIRIRITCEQTIRYNQIVEMTRNRWEQIKRMPECDMEDPSISPLDGYLDLKDPVDWDDFEDVEMIVVDDDGKPVKPRDEYEGGE